MNVSQTLELTEKDRILPWRCSIVCIELHLGDWSDTAERAKISATLLCQMSVLVTCIASVLDHCLVNVSAARDHQ